MNEKLGLMIKDVSKEEIKQILETVREIERKNPSRLILCWVLGLDSAPNAMNVEQAVKFIEDVFPQVKKESSK